MGDFTVAEAQHLIQTHGGPIGWPQALFQLALVGGVAWLIARAIASGSINVWQVALPMVAEYLVFLIVLPIAQVFLRHPELQRDTNGSLYLGLVLLVGSVAGEYVRAEWFTNQSWFDQIRQDLKTAGTWLMQSSMIWPIGLAAVNSGYNAIASIGKLLRFGPPFIGVGLGCGMRIAVFGFAILVFPIFAILVQNVIGSSPSDSRLSLDSKAWMWLIWTLMVASELLTLAMKLDLQNRLKNVGAPIDVASDEKRNQGPPPESRI